MQFWCSLILKLHQKCIKTPWNYIKSASRVHHNFWTFLHIFPQILLKILKKHDAVLMQFWNYIILMHFWCSIKGFWCTFDVVSKLNHIKSASKPFETTSKVHQNDVVSKLDQKCIIFWTFLHFLQKWVHAQVVKSFFENRKIDVAQTDHSRSVEGLHR